MKTKLIAFLSRTGDIETGYLYTFITQGVALLIQNTSAVLVSVYPLIKSMDVFAEARASVDEILRFSTSQLFGEDAISLRRTVFDKSFYQSFDTDHHRVMNWQPTTLSELGQLPHPTTLLLNPLFSEQQLKVLNRDDKTKLQYLHISCLNETMTMARLMVAESMMVSDTITKYQFDNLCGKYKPLSTRPVDGTLKLSTQLPDNSVVVSEQVSDGTYRLFVPLHFMS
jgi:hypothetical protein